MDTPNTLDTMLKDIEGMNAAVDYFTTNINRIPPMLQIKFLEETLAYAEKIKPLYVMALALRGDSEKGET